MKEYIRSLEKEFSLIENGFKEEEKRALTDYKSNDNEYIKNLAFLAYKSGTYQVGDAQAEWKRTVRTARQER